MSEAGNRARRAVPDRVNLPASRVNIHTYIHIQRRSAVNSRISTIGPASWSGGAHAARQERVEERSSEVIQVRLQ